MLQEFLTFAGDHWIMALAMMWMIVCIAKLLLWFLRSIFIRALRVIAIGLRGWPPEHLDADGYPIPVKTVKEQRKPSVPSSPTGAM